MYIVNLLDIGAFILCLTSLLDYDKILLEIHMFYPQIS